MTYPLLRRGSAALMFVVTAMLFPAPAAAVTIDFEGIGCQTQFGSAAGFSFSANWVTQCDADYAASWGNTTGAPSAVTAAGNTYFDASGVTISRAATFDLIGGQASSFLVADDFDFFTPMSSWSLLIEGYLDNVFVGSQSVVFDPGNGGVGTGYHAFGSIFGINELRFFSTFDQNLSGNLDYWLIDDLEIADPVSAVPEPASLLLLGAGLAVLGARVRLRRSQRHAAAGPRG